MITLDEQQFDLANRIANKVAKLKPSVRGMIRIGGAIGTGCTTTLELTREPLKELGFVPIALPNEQSEFDTASVLLARLIDQVPKDYLPSIDMSFLASPKEPWQDKFSKVCEFIDARADSIVLLCDEPHYWSRLERMTQDVANSDTVQFSNWLLREAKCRRIVTGDMPEGLPFIETLTLNNSLESVPIDDFHSLESSIDLASLLASIKTGGSEYRAVMEIRLAVAIAWFVSERKAVQVLKCTTNSASILKLLIDQIEQQARTTPRFKSICRTLSQMTIGRSPWTDSSLATLAPDLQAQDRLIIKSSFCEDWGEGFHLHPYVRYEVLGRGANRLQPELRQLWRLSSDERTKAHVTVLESLHQSKPGESLVDDIEYLNHWAFSGDKNISTEDERIHFVEQLHEIGAELSYRYRQHPKAVEIYRLALGFDKTNARTHHYLAFNLDWDANEPTLVEDHYQKAIEYNPQHPWYHSRWISYLVTRGRNKDARKAFRHANDVMPVSCNSPEYVFKGLHRWIARWMLHWGELAMAEDVLNSIPPAYRDERSVVRLQEMLETLKLAELGIAVFPLSIRKSHWWNPAGHTGLPGQMDGKLLTWKPARVDAVCDGIVYLKIGQKDKVNPHGFVYYDETLERELVERCVEGFQWSDLAEGRYLELGYYGDSGLMKIGMHRSLELDDPEILPLVPPPDRWYERARDNACQQLKGGTW
jgi:tetratricopeptide (TPR) repeat protein